jgi:hypothetical protein
MRAPPEFVEMQGRIIILTLQWQQSTTARGTSKRSDA